MKVIWLNLVLLLLQFSGQSMQSTVHRFGTKTAYHFNRSFNATTAAPHQCTPIHLNMVLRHGSRFPGDSDRKKVGKLLSRLSRIYNESFPFRYRNLTIPWTKPVEWNDAISKELSPLGEKEQYEIARRFRSRYPQIFEKLYWNKYYTFLARDKRRTSQSAMAFAYGLFKNKGRVSVSRFQPVAIRSAGREENDKLLSSYDACPRYAIDVEKNGVAEVNKFAEGPEVENVTRRLEDRLRVAGKMSLTSDDVEIILKLCAFGVMNRQDDSWCALLSSEDLDVLAYLSDLENYYEHSYGNKLSYQIICELLSDMTKDLESFSQGKSDLYGAFRFASSGTLFSLLTILGFFEGTPKLRADNYRENTNRKFTSDAVTMSTNVAMVLYKCNVTGNTGKQEYKVQVLVNEVPVGLPCCHGNLTCSLGQFLSHFKATVDGCDFDAMCSLPVTTTATTPKSFGWSLRAVLWLTCIAVLLIMFP